MNSEIKKVLVTGGAGYIGSIVVRQLLERGYVVRVLDRLIFTDKALEAVKSKIELVEGDIRTANHSTFNDVDAVIHLAGFSTEPTSQYNHRLTDMVNHIATEHLVKMARNLKIKRFIYASSCSVYFTLNTPLEPPLYGEDDIVNPISCYSITKRCSEQALFAMTDKNFQPTIFRKGTLYGFSPRMRYDLVFNSFVKDAFCKRTLSVDAGGEIWRPMIDVQDAAKAYIDSLEMPLELVGGKIFNVVDENWNIGALAQIVKKVVEAKKSISIELDVKPYGITRNYKASTDLFKKTFNFKPVRTMEDALLEIWEHLENDKSHDPNNKMYYGDQWYREYFKTEAGQDFQKYV